jgi:hypothetical protein
VDDGLVDEFRSALDSYWELLRLASDNVKEEPIRQVMGFLHRLIEQASMFFAFSLPHLGKRD